MGFTMDKIGIGRSYTTHSSIGFYRADLDNYLQYKNRYEKTVSFSESFWEELTRYGRVEYIEIDCDVAKNNSENYLFNSGEARKVPAEVVQQRYIRDRMTNVAASADPTALAITRDGMDRVDRNESNEFEYRMEDTRGNKHQ